MKTRSNFPLSISGSRFSRLRLVVLLAALAAPGFFPSAQGAEELSATLQRGLFEEEANHDLNAAIKAYETVVAATDAQRKLAGTALFRLAECYRKLERTNDAVIHYQRVVQEYPDQARLADLSRQYLVSASKTTSTPTSTTAAARAPLPADDEDKEIRSIQALVKDSPDLINARNQFTTIWEGNQVPSSPLTGLTLLHKAAAQGQIKLAEFLLANGADVNASSAAGTSAGPTPLSLAARAGRKSMVELLLAKGARVQGNVPFTPLHEAARQGYKSVVEMLLEAGANVNAEDNVQRTPLHEAADRGFGGVAQVLIARGADANARFRARAGPEQLPRNGPSLHFVGSALHSACQRGDKGIVDLLLTNKADVNLRSYYGLTPLHVAAYQGQLPIITSLLAAGADVNACVTDTSGNKTNMWAPLHLAILANLPDVVRLLLKNRADPNQVFDNHRGQDGWSALHQLLSEKPKDYLVMAQLLFDHKANPNLTNDSGYGPIFFVIHDDKASLELLLKNGADANLRDPEGKTALNSFSQHGYLREPWQVLLAQGADPNTQDKSGQTPLHRLVWRAQQPKPGVPGLVTQATADPNSPAALAELLFAHGADPNVRDVNGLTALNLLGVPASASQPDGKALVSVLRSHGAKDELMEPGPDPEAVRVWRKGRAAPRTVFLSDAGRHNRYTLFETILNFYKTASSPARAAYFPPTAAVPTPTAPGTAIPTRPIRNVSLSGGFSAVEELPFPDFTRVRVQRFVDAATTEKKVFEYNLLDAEGKFDCTKDRLLEFGDLVILPEREFNLSEGKVGLTRPQEDSLRNCLRCRVTFIVKGERRELDLGPSGHSYWFAHLIQLPGVRSVLRSSSDLSRLTIRRTDPQTQQPTEFLFDASDGRAAAQPENDLWLRDGDVIEVPEK